MDDDIVKTQRVNEWVNQKHDLFLILIKQFLFLNLTKKQTLLLSHHKVLEVDDIGYNSDNRSIRSENIV